MPAADDKTQAPDVSASEFERQSHERQPGIVAEFVDFLIHNKKWWLLPILIVLLLAGALVLLSGSPFAPFIYPLF
jgi:hypothetical protein